MNGFDVIVIILILIFGIGGLVLGVGAIKDKEYKGAFGIWALDLFIIGIGMSTFTVIDRGSGATVGEVTSVDKNFFGTTALYIKTSENTQEKYCIEDREVAEQAKELLGKKIKISYGERIGLYSTTKCHKAPVETIREIKEGKNG